MFALRLEADIWTSVRHFCVVQILTFTVMRYCAVQPPSIGMAAPVTLCVIG
jgi:hypothetical protein